MKTTITQVKEYLKSIGLDGRTEEFSVSSATVALAAEALGTEECRIAKTLSFMTQNGPILIVMAGDVKIDNHKYKEAFGTKAKMLSFDEVEEFTGYAVGGVCPFLAKEGVRVYLDRSLLRFDTVYPAAGTASSAVRLTVEELARASRAEGYVDVSRPINS